MSEEIGTGVATRNAAAIIAALQTDLDIIRAESSEKQKTRKKRRVLAEIVFAYWASKFDHPRALLDPKRERRIMARLEECGDNVSDLLYALDGARKDKWTMGEDSHSTRRYDDVETILRDRGQVEKFGERMKGFRENSLHPLAQKYRLNE